MGLRKKTSKNMLRYLDNYVWFLLRAERCRSLELRTLERRCLMRANKLKKILVKEGINV